MKKSIRLIAAVGIVLTLAAGSPVAAADAATKTSGTEGLAYVALGDSFAAGLGLSPATGKPVEGCEQSSTNYPHRVAETLGMSLTDVSCTGAVTANVTHKAQRTESGTAPAQLPALSNKTRVVTITLGGNDLGFFTTAIACMALSANGPILSSGKSNCRSSYIKNGVDTLAARVTGSLLEGNGSGTNGLTATFAAMKKAAPHAKVFVVGYPTILPNAQNTPAQGCFRGTISGSDVSALSVRNGLPFTPTDVSYLNSIQQSLDAASLMAARKAGFTYISALAASATHSACALADESYINGVNLSSDNRLNITLSTGALHPNERGAAFLAGLVDAAVRKAFPVETVISTEQSSPGHVTSPVPWIAAAAVFILLAAVPFVLWRRSRRASCE